MGVLRQRPGALALLIHRLLDDITARAADDTRGAPEGLEWLFTTACPEEPPRTSPTRSCSRRQLITQ
ncbi:hypothetical protein [Actinoplanes auranticolor]|uniref:hypothetical protein n=1 Tax=Actinoplanes auranticolor TaxID=47988 RepID=UPI0031E92169